MTPSPAKAQPEIPAVGGFWVCTDQNCICVWMGFETIRTLINQEYATDRIWIRDINIGTWRDFFMPVYFFREHILTTARMAADTLTATAMQQMFMIGSMMDAQHGLETQRLFQEKAARAHRDYHPDMQLCQMGTVSRRLAQEQRDGLYNAFLLAQRSQDRQRHTIEMDNEEATGLGRDSDLRGRLAVIKESTCVSTGPEDNGVCPGSAAATDLTANGDVDYIGMVGLADNIDMGHRMFATTVGLDGDEIARQQEKQRAFFALATNLYANEVIDPIPPAKLRNPANHDEILDMRAIVAKRAVAEHSFNAITAMKTPGFNEETEMGDYVRAAMLQLDISEELAEDLVPDNPSYHQIMEILTRKMYQTPEFYTNLYDKPAGIERKGAAMTAVRLMQDMDMYKSRLRNEMMLAVLVELEIARQQSEEAVRLGAGRPTGPTNVR